MYTPFQLAKKYLHYYFTAANGRGHGVHSPFVFDFINKVLKDTTPYPAYEILEQRRRALRKDATVIEVEDFGAGSGVIKTRQRVVKDIANSSLKPAKYASLLFRIVQYYHPKHIIELGTSFGITTGYLAAGDQRSKVSTCEGSTKIAAIAQTNFELFKLENIELITGDFAQTFPSLLSRLKQVDLAFIDGNHRREPTLHYFEQLLLHATPDSILIFDDIHWSEEMETAWLEIQQHDAVTLTIDLFFIGLVFINPDFKVKQHFKIRF